MNVAATPTGDSRGEVELNSAEQTTERRENRALNTVESGSQAHLKTRIAEKSLQWRSTHFATLLHLSWLSELASYDSLNNNGDCSKEA